MPTQPFTPIYPGRVTRQCMSLLLAALVAVGLALPVAAQSTPDPASAAAEAPGAEIKGLLIVAVEAGSPAAAAGLERGDILLLVDDAAVDDIPMLLDALAAAGAGSQVELTWRHGAETRTASVVLAERNGGAFLGVQPYWEPGDARRPLRQFLTPLPTDLAGALILEVLPDSAAAAAGLAPGQVIIAVNGEPVAAPQALQDAVWAAAPGDELALTLHAAEEEAGRTVTVTLGAAADNEEQAYLGVRVAAVDMAPGMRFMGPGLRGKPGAGAEAYPFHMAPWGRGMMGPGMMGPGMRGHGRGFHMEEWDGTAPMRPGMGPRWDGRGLQPAPENDTEPEGAAPDQEQAWRLDWRRGGAMLGYRPGMGMDAMRMFGVWMLNRMGIDVERLPLYRFFFAPGHQAAPDEGAPTFRRLPGRQDFF